MKQLRLFLVVFVFSIALGPVRFASGAEPTPMRVTSHFLVSGENLSHQKRVPQTKFSVQDYIAFITVLQWDDVTKSRGKHTVTWNWYHGNKLVSSVTKKLDFNHTPYDLYSKRAASDLGSGQLKVEVLIDKSVAASNTFTIGK